MIDEEKRMLGHWSHLEEPPFVGPRILGAKFFTWSPAAFARSTSAPRLFQTQVYNNNKPQPLFLTYLLLDH
jgi:hypothetical protein